MIILAFRRRDIIFWGQRIEQRGEQWKAEHVTWMGGRGRHQTKCPLLYIMSAGAVGCYKCIYGRLHRQSGVCGIESCARKGRTITYTHERLVVLCNLNWYLYMYVCVTESPSAQHIKCKETCDKYRMHMRCRRLPPTNVALP